MAIYAKTWSNWLGLIPVIDKEGMFLEDGKLNPKQREFDALTTQLSKLGAEFGLSPSSRSRLVASPKNEVNPIDEFLKRKMNERN
jgi:P27 family predicted phage terminase small subunit